MLNTITELIGKLGIDSSASAIQTMPLVDTVTGTVVIKAHSIIELEDGADITVTKIDGSTFDIVSDGARHYSIRKDIKQIVINAGTVRIA